MIALSADLVETRFKDHELSYQRGIMLLGLLYVLVRKLTEWLSTDALTFQILFLGSGDNDPLANERAILEKLFYEEIALDVVQLKRQQPGKLARLCEDWTRKSMVHILMAGVRPELLDVKDAVTTRLAIDGPRPALGDGSGELGSVEGDDAADTWGHALQGLLMRWV